MNGASDEKINPRNIPAYYFRQNGFQQVDSDLDDDDDDDNNDDDNCSYGDDNAMFKARCCWG